MITMISLKPSTSPPKRTYLPASGVCSEIGWWPQMRPAKKRSTKPSAMVRITIATCDWPNMRLRMTRSTV